MILVSGEYPMTGKPANFVLRLELSGSSVPVTVPERKTVSQHPRRYGSIFFM
jgi:hypothetical protein